MIGSNPNRRDALRRLVSGLLVSTAAGLLLPAAARAGPWISSGRFSAGGGAPGGHAWWRVLVPETQAGSPFVLSCVTLEMRATVGGADQCSGGTPFASSTNGSFPVSNAFDGSSATMWVSSGNTPQYIGYHFAAAVNVAEIAWTVRNDGFFSNESPTYGLLQYSDDTTNGTDGTWTLEDAMVPTPWSAGQTQAITIIPGAYHFYRVLVTACQATPAASFSKVEFSVGSGGTNVATGGRAYAESATTGWPATNAFDGVDSTSWLSGTNGSLPDWIEYGFVGNPLPDTVRLRNRADAFGVNEAPSAFKVQRSKDRSTYVDLINPTGIAAWSSSGTTREYSW